MNSLKTLYVIIVTSPIHSTTQWTSNIINYSTNQFVLNQNIFLPVYV